MVPNGSLDFLSIMSCSRSSRKITHLGIGCVTVSKDFLSHQACIKSTQVQTSSPHHLHSGYHDTWQCLCTSHFHKAVQNELFVFSSSFSHSSWCLRSQMSWALMLHVSHDTLTSAHCMEYSIWPSSSSLVSHVSVLLQRKSVFSNVSHMHQSHDIIPWFGSAALHDCGNFNVATVSRLHRRRLKLSRLFGPSTL